MVPGPRRAASREVSWGTIASTATALGYVLSPVDLVPNVIPVVGLVDDADVVSICLRAIDEELGAYKRWLTGS